MHDRDIRKCVSEDTSEIYVSLGSRNQFLMCSVDAFPVC
jgi:hypothetical protein